MTIYKLTVKVPKQPISHVIISSAPDPYFEHTEYYLHEKDAKEREVRIRTAEELIGNFLNVRVSIETIDVVEHL